MTMDYHQYLLHKLIDEIFNDHDYIEKLILNYNQYFLEQFEIVFVNSQGSENSLWNENKSKYFKLLRDFKSYNIKNVSDEKLETSPSFFLEHLRKNKKDRVIFLKEVILDGFQGIFPDLYIVAPVLLKIMEDAEKHKESNKKDLKKMVLFKMIIPQVFYVKLYTAPNNLDLDYRLIETQIYPFLFKVLGIKLDLSIYRPLQRLVQCAKFLNPKISQNKLAKIFGVTTKTIREIENIKTLKEDRINEECSITNMDRFYKALQKAQREKLKNRVFSPRFGHSKEIEEIIKQIKES